MSLRLSFKRLVRAFQHDFFATECHCIICGRELTVGGKYNICPKCHNNIVTIDNRYCMRCGRQLYAEEMYCYSCQNNHRDFDMVRSLFCYEGALPKLLLNYKFHNGRFMAKYLAEMIRDVYYNYNYDCDIVLSVPISDERRKERGYNQADLLAEEVTSRRGGIVNGREAPYIDLPYYAKAIVKIRDNDRQTALGGADRQKNVKGVYSVAQSEAVKGKRILLIDDIMTTGVTCSEVARTLKAAGAKEVNCIVLAIAPYHIELDDIE